MDSPRRLLPIVILGCLSTLVHGQVLRNGYRWEPAIPIGDPYYVNMWHIDVPNLATRRSVLQIQRQQDDLSRVTNQAIERNARDLRQLTDDVRKLPDFTKPPLARPTGMTIRGVPLRRPSAKYPESLRKREDSTEAKDSSERQGALPRGQVLPPQRTVRPTGTGSVFRSHSQYFPRLKTSGGAQPPRRPMPR